MVKQSALMALVGIALVSSALRASAQTPPSKLDPPGPPAPTMKTLDEIAPTWSQVLPADDSGDPCHSARFTCVLPDQNDPTGSAVLDKETGLVWTRQPRIARKWELDDRVCMQSPFGGRFGFRLPSVDELSTLTEPLNGRLHLPSGHPFTSVASDFYFSSTDDPSDPSRAFVVILDQNVTFLSEPKTAEHPAFCVRGPRPGR